MRKKILILGLALFFTMGLLSLSFGEETDISGLPPADQATIESFVVEDLDGNVLTSIPPATAFNIMVYLSESTYLTRTPKFTIKYERSDTKIVKKVKYKFNPESTYWRLSVTEAVRSYATGTCTIKVNVPDIGKGSIQLPIQ